MFFRGVRTSLGQSPNPHLNKMNIRITRYDHANQYDTDHLGLLIPRDKQRSAFATVQVGPINYKCVDVSRTDAKALLITMRKVMIER